MGPNDVFAKAEVAYERGLARRAILAAWPAVAVAGVAIACARPPAVALAIVGAAVVFLYLGRGFARGVWTGIMVGIAPCIAPTVGRLGHECASMSCASLCLVVCASGGLVAGLAAGALARGDVRRAASSMVIAGLVGALGCTGLGAFALAGMAIALLSGAAVPTLVWRRA